MAFHSYGVAGAKRVEKRATPKRAKLKVGARKAKRR